MNLTGEWDEDFYLLSTRDYGRGGANTAVWPRTQTILATPLVHIIAKNSLQKFLELVIVLLNNKTNL